MPYGFTSAELGEAIKKNKAERAALVAQGASADKPAEIDRNLRDFYRRETEARIREDRRRAQRR